mgnify:CR=1 FL=1
MASQLRFDNKVAIVTNVGEGIGQQCAVAFASRGAKVVVHDQNAEAVDKVVKEIKAKGGNVVAVSAPTESGDKIVKTAMDAFGRVDIIVNNPVGLPKDLPFHKMTKQDWDAAIKAQAKATFSVTHAAWNIMRDQGFGRIINFSSSGGLYGNLGQAHYSAAKLAIHGLTLSLAKEGEKRNMLVNTVSPFVPPKLIEGVLSEDILTGLKGEYIVPLVVFLSHESCQENGSLFEAAGGFVSKYRWNRSDGVVFDLPFTPETVRDEWERVGDFTKNDAPTGMNDTFPKIMGNAEKLKAMKAQETQAKPAQTTTATTTTAPAGGNTLKTDNTFQLMNAYLATGAGKDVIAKLQSVFGFEITPKKGEPPARIWTIDLKNGNGSVKLGKPENPDATFTMTDDDMDLLTQGKLNGQTAFVQVNYDNLILY